MLLIVLAYLGGVLTILSPCILRTAYPVARSRQARHSPMPRIRVPP